MKTSSLFTLIAWTVAAPHLGPWWALALFLWFAGWAIHYIRKGR